MRELFFLQIANRESNYLGKSSTDDEKLLLSSDQPPEIASVWHACGAIFYRMLVNSGSTQKRQSVHKRMYAYLLIGHVWRFYLCLRSEPAHDSRAKRKGIVTFYFFSRSFKDWRRYSGTLSLELAWPSLFLNPSSPS